MTETRNNGANASVGLPPGAVDLADCGRQVRGFLAAAFVPGALGGLAMVISGSISGASPAADPTLPLLVGKMMAYAVLGTFFGLLVTVPTIVVAGLPAYVLFRRLGWTDWPRHLMGGAMIGWCAGLVAFGGWPSLQDVGSFEVIEWAIGRQSPWRLGSAFLGAASVLMLWSVIHTRRAWLTFLGLLSACPLVTWWLS